MTRSFKKTSIRLLSLVLALLMVAGLFAGCSKTKDEDTTPSSEDNVPPGLVEVKPTEPSTEPPTTEETKPLDKNGAVINKDDTAVRQTPSADADPIGYLNKGTTVTIIREVSIANVGWALIREGWVKSESLDKNYVGDDTTEPDSTTPPETKPAENNNGGTTSSNNNNNNNNNNNTTNNNTNTGNGKGTMGVVTASELNVRKEADQNSDRVDTYKFGDRLTILETKNGWGRTNKGWVSLNYVYEDGEKGTNPCNGVVIASQLNVRTGPGTKYDRASALNFGARVNVLERITLGDTTWGYVNGGWISMEHVYVDGTKGQGAGEGTCTGDNVNIRSGPGTKYQAVGSANKNDNITIYFQIELGDTTWGYVAKGETKGWMSMQFANMG